MGKQPELKDISSIAMTSSRSRVEIIWPWKTTWARKIKQKHRARNIPVWVVQHRVYKQINMSLPRSTGETKWKEIQTCTLKKKKMHFRHSISHVQDRFSNMFMEWRKGCLASALYHLLSLVPLCSYYLVCTSSQTHAPSWIVVLGTLHQCPFPPLVL